MKQLRFGTLVLKDENEYYISLGSFCNKKAFSISYEPNKSTGSYADAYRIRKLASAKNLIEPITAAIRTGGRINSNRYVMTLIANHNFVQNGKQIYGTLENVLKTIPEEYISSFIQGYTSSGETDDKTIVVYETENVKKTAKSLKKANMPKSSSSKKSSSQKKKKTKHDYIKEHIKNIDIGQRGEKLVIEYEREKLKKAVENSTIASMENLLKWVSLEDDSAGYDILSYDIEKKQPIFIEVKTTLGNNLTPFYMSLRELDFSKNNAEQYCLYRIYNLKNEQADFFEISGDITTYSEVQIDAVNYLVQIK